MRFSSLFVLAFIFGVRSRASAKRTLFALIPVAGFTGIWILLSDEMNWMGRFQYALLPIILMSWPSLMEGISRDWRLPALRDFDRRGRRVMISILLICGLGLLLYQEERYGRVRYFPDGRHDGAVLLSKYSDRGYTMAVTEAGLLPLYSRWKAIDAWGLNDSWIARNGGITKDYLASRKPEIIMFHAGFSPLTYDQHRKRGAWASMVETMKAYAETSGYILAAAFGESPYDTHYYYVRPDFADSEAIVREIRGLDYRWFKNGKRCFNYAELVLAKAY